MEHSLGESLKQAAIRGDLQQIQALFEAYGAKAICADEDGSLSLRVENPHITDRLLKILS